MSRIYGKDENDKPLLLALECDDCPARIKPNKDIASSGWTTRGQDNGPGTDKLYWDYCENCG
jgi:hypothetical protein